MALNPEIALGFRSPQINLDVPSPIHQMGQMMTLRGLMEQQQLRRSQIEQEQFKLESLREANAGQQEFQRRALAGENLTQGQTLGYLGPKLGTDFLKGQSELEEQRIKQQRAQEEQQEKYLRMLGQAGLASKNQQDRDFRIKLLVSGKVIPQEVANQMLAQPFDLEATQTFGQQFMTMADQLKEKREAAERAFKEQKEPLELRTAAAQATTAEQTAAGTKPIQPEEQARLEAEKVRLDREAAAAKETARHNRAMENRAAQATAAGLTQSQSQRVLQIAGQFDNEPMVKNYNVIGEANNFVKSLGEKGGGNAGDDQALLYAFAKAMDPGSVVREGEYATVQRYAQSWADTFGFKTARIFSNSPFLSDDARKQMKATIEKRAASAKTSYDNIYNEYGRRIERQSGVQSGKDYLTNYGQAFEGGAAPAAAPQPAAAAPKKAPPAVGTVKDGYRFLGGDPGNPKNWQLALTVK